MKLALALATTFALTVPALADTKLWEGKAENDTYKGSAELYETNSGEVKIRAKIIDKTVDNGDGSGLNKPKKVVIHTSDILAPSVKVSATFTYGKGINYAAKKSITLRGLGNGGGSPSKSASNMGVR